MSDVEEEHVANQPKLVEGGKVSETASWKNIVANCRRRKQYLVNGLLGRFAYPRIFHNERKMRGCRS